MPRLRTTGSAITFSASRKSGKRSREQRRLQQVHVPRERADPDLVALLADVGELAEVVDVDQVLGVGQPQLHHRQQAVPAGDDARLGAEPLRATRSRRRRWSRARTRMPRGSATVLLSGSVRDRHALARLADVVALLVLLGGVGADHRRAGQVSAASPGGPRGRAAARRGCRPSTFLSTGPAGLAVAIGASRPSRASVSVPLRVDLADARRVDVLALREVAEALGARRPGRGRRRGRPRPPCRPSSRAGPRAGRRRRRAAR